VSATASRTSPHKATPRTSPDTGTMRAALRVPFDPDGVTIEGFAPDATPCAPSRGEAERALRDELLPRLTDLHDLLMANADRSVLLVLQGLDGSGKSGTIKHVISAMNPVGTCVTSFDAPSRREKAEPFLERIRRALPARGEVGVFDRSHYEDAIVPRALGQIDDTELGERVRTILRFERGLVAKDVLVVKCVLLLSYDEQRRRFVRRLRRADKQWKFSEADVATRRQWPQFQAAYGEVIGRTSTDEAPWYAVPADHKWYRNWAVASLLVEILEALDQRYPTLAADLDIEAMCDQLEPPN
jgi:PPK2 family polyphosphate:nucleotide phosphotransferase